MPLTADRAKPAVPFGGPVPAHRLRDLQPHQLGAAPDRRSSRSTSRTASTGTSRRRGACRRCWTRTWPPCPRSSAWASAGSPGSRRRDPAEPQPHQRRAARHRRRDRRRPRVPDGLPADAGRAHRLRRAGDRRRHPPAHLALAEPVRRHRRRPEGRPDAASTGSSRSRTMPTGLADAPARGAGLDGQLHLRHRRAHRGRASPTASCRRPTTTWAATSSRTSSVAARRACTT